MPTMKAVQVSKAGAPFELVDRDMLLLIDGCEQCAEAYSAECAANRARLGF